MGGKVEKGPSGLSVQGSQGLCSVEGSSMQPTLFPGDEVIVDLERRSFRRGDLIVFRAADQLVVHRVIRPEPRLLTSGDNAPSVDEPVSLDSVVGRVSLVRRDSRPLSMLSARQRLTNWLLGWTFYLGRRSPRWRRAATILARLSAREAPGREH
jgi:hypothetical protein